MRTFSEELLLLAIKDEEGTLVASASSFVPYGIALAILLDLQEANKLKFINKQICLIDFSPTGIDFLDVPLVALKNISEDKEIKFWVKAFGLKNNYYIKLIFDKLIKDEILIKEEKRTLWIKYQNYPTANPEPELRTRALIHKAIESGSCRDKKLENLIMLMYFCNLTSEVFPKGKRKNAKSTIKRLIKYNEVGIVLSEVIKEMTMSAKLLRQ